MPDPLGHVRPGDAFKPSAAAWNAFCDTAKAERARQFDAAGRVPTRFGDPDIVRVLNQSGMDLPRFSVLGLDGPIFIPDDPDQLAAFLQEVTFRGAIPDEALHRGKFAILLEPAKDGVVVKAWVSGVCICKVDMLAEGDSHADITPGETGYLTGGGSGACQILWTQGDEPYGYGYETGEQWAIVRFGGGGGGRSLALLPAGGIAPHGTGEVTFFDDIGTLSARTAEVTNPWETPAPELTKCAVGGMSGVAGLAVLWWDCAEYAEGYY